MVKVITPVDEAGVTLDAETAGKTIDLKGIIDY